VAGVPARWDGHFEAVLVVDHDGLHGKQRLDDQLLDGIEGR